MNTLHPHPEWSRRPREVRNLLNPAFCGLLIAEAVEQHALKRPMPFALAFLVLPLVLHGPTRAALPSTIATPLATWVSEHATLTYDLGQRVTTLLAVTKESLIWCLASGLLAPSAGALSYAGESTRRPVAPPDPFDDFKICVSRARLLGRWFANSGNAATLYMLFGLRP